MMLSKGQMIDLLYKINRKLEEKDIHGEILMAGGASLSLVYDARDATKDIDALFEPASSIRQIAKELAQENDLEEDWLNDAVKGFIDTRKQKTDIYLQLSNLTVKTIDARGLLAMKLVSARGNSNDLIDAVSLMKHLKIKDIEELYDITEQRIPKNQLTPKATFFIQVAFSEYEKSIEHGQPKGNERSLSPKHDIAMGIDSAGAQALGSGEDPQEPPVLRLDCRNGWCGEDRWT